MASMQCLCVVLLLSTVARAQEAQINTTEAVVTRENQPAAPVEQPLPPEVNVPPAGTPAQSAAIVTESAPQAVEDPLIAAKQLEGGASLDKIPLVAEVDAIKKVLGSNCSVDGDCIAINNSTCKNNMCDCITGFIPSKHSLDKCVKVPIGVGDSCEENAQCSHVVPDSECHDSLCVCPPNYVLGFSRCWQKQTLGGICNMSVQCEDVMFATCTQNVCSCEDPLIPSPINKCLQPAGNVYQAPCVEDIQCTHSYGDEARCSNDGLCRCTNNYHFDGAKCVVDIKLGEGCLTDENCVVSEANHEEGTRVCLDNVCACAPGYTTLPGEEICTKSSGEELAVSLTWVMCIVLAKYYLS